MLSLGFFIAEMSQETGGHDMCFHRLQGFSEHLHDEAHEALLARQTLCFLAVFFCTEQTEQRWIFLAILLNYAKLWGHFQFHFAHRTLHVSNPLENSSFLESSGTAHLLATPEELCKPLRLLRLSQYPQCILVETAIGASKFISIGFIQS